MKKPIGIARIRAAELGTSLSALVRSYLKAFVREQADGTEASRTRRGDRRLNAADC